MSNPQMLYDNRFADAVPTATSTAAGYSVLHLLDWNEFTCWKSETSADQTITVDCGSAAAADALGFVAHNLAGAQVVVECSADNFSAETVVALSATSIEGGVFFKPFTSVSRRYWRVRFSGLSAACYVGVLALGEVLVFDQPIYGDYTPEVIQQSATVSESQDGHVLGVVLGLAQTKSALDFQYVSDAWFKNTMTPAWENHLIDGLSVFFAPAYAEQPSDVFFYHVVSSVGFDGTYQAGEVRRFSLDFRGVYRCAVPSPAVPWGDDFNGDAFGPVTAPLWSAGAGTDSYGNARTVDAQSSAPNTVITINAGASTGLYAHSQDSGVLGLSQANYSLGGFDLTSGGSFNAFRIRINSTNSGGSFGVIVDGETVLLSSTAVLADNGSITPSYADILFSDFVTADLTSASTVSLYVDGITTADFDISFDSIEAGVSVLSSSGGSGV